jgi:phosphorylase kinase alpha/beta subunit
MLLILNTLKHVSPQVEPVQIWPPSELAKAYEKLGVNEKLGLTGRPARPIGGLGTSKVNVDKFMQLL